MLNNLIPGQNGNNECYASMSKTLGLKFTKDKNDTEIPIEDNSKIIQIWIPRNNLNTSEFVLFDVKKTNKIYSFNQRLIFNQSNASLHIFLSPVNLTIGYLVNIYSKDYLQITKIMCPRGYFFSTLKSLKTNKINLYKLQK